MNIEKTGVINSCGTINSNICTWNYSINPYLPNSAGNTLLATTIYNDYTRYISSTAGTNGGKYGYPVGSSGMLVQGNTYTWSCEFRAKTPITFSAGRLGFEGGGMLFGGSIIIGTDWTRLTKTWTQTNSQAFVFYPCGDLTEGEWIDIRNLKLEEGSILTPFIPPNSSVLQGFIESNYKDSKTQFYKQGYINSTEFIEI